MVMDVLKRLVGTYLLSNINKYAIDSERSRRVLLFDSAGAVRVMDYRQTSAGLSVSCNSCHNVSHRSHDRYWQADPV